MKGLIIILVITHAGAITAVFNPYVGLLIYVSWAIIKPEAEWAYMTGTAENYSRIVAIGMLIGWALRGFGDWRLGKGMGILFCFFGYFAWIFLSANLAAADANAGMNVFWAIGRVFLPFLVGMTLIDSVKKLKQLAWVVVLSQGFIAYELNSAWFFRGYNRVTEQGWGAMEEGSIAIGMNTVAGLALFLGLNTPSWWRKALAFGLAGLMIHVPMLAFSRGGMLGLLCMAVVGFLIMPKRPIYILVMVVMVLFGLRLAGKEVRQRFASTMTAEEERDWSAQSRVVMWGQCVGLMRQHPLLGIGPSHWPFIAHEFGWGRGKEAHTLWLQTGAELGIPGLGFLALFYLLCAWRMYLLAIKGTPDIDPWMRDVARGIVCSLVGFAVSAQFISLWGLETPFYLTMLGAGILKVQFLSKGAAAPVARPVQTYVRLPVAYAPRRSWA